MSSSHNYSLLIIVFLFSLGAKAQSQKDYQKEYGSAINLDRTAIDSTGVSYFTLKDINRFYQFQDTTLRDIEKFISVRTFDKGALTLGNYGSAHLPIKYQVNDELWKDPGFHQYDQYKLNRDDLKFYRHGLAFNDLFFSPVGGQENFIVKAKFSNNFKDNVNLSLDYERINQDGIYSAQNTKSTKLGAGIWKHNKKNNHHFFLTLIANNHNETHNGGVMIQSDRTFRSRSTEPIYLNSSGTRHQHFSYAMDNFFGVRNRPYEIHHQISYDHGYFRFSDDDINTASDSLVYNNFITDNRGSRYFMGFLRLKNTVDLGISKEKLDLRVGLAHQYAKYSRDEGKLNFNELFLFSKLNFQLGEYADLAAQAHLGAGSNAGNLNLQGQLNLTPIEGISIGAKMVLRRYDPTLIHENLSITTIPVYAIDTFSKINEVQLGGQLRIDKLNLELELSSGVVDNPVSYDTLATPLQNDASIEYLQASVEHRFFWKFVGIENSLMYQRFSENIYRLPKLYGLHNLFVEFPLFKKKLLTRTGVIYYSLDLDGAQRFMPVTGAFYPSTQRIRPYDYYEFYANFQISDLRLFFKIENLNDLFIPQEHYHIINHPQADWHLRLGARWLIRG